MTSHQNADCSTQKPPRGFNLARPSITEDIRLLITLMDNRDESLPIRSSCAVGAISSSIYPFNYPLRENMPLNPCRSNTRFNTPHAAVSSSSQITDSFSACGTEPPPLRAFLLVALFFVLFSLHGGPAPLIDDVLQKYPISGLNQSKDGEPPSSRYTYATFLSSRTEDIDDDTYFTAARVSYLPNPSSSNNTFTGRHSTPYHCSSPMFPRRKEIP